MSLHQPPTSRAWMRLPSGGRLDLISPDPKAWTDEDLAIRLSRTYRWGGESKWPLAMSVAQHSLQVLELARKWAPQPLSPTEALRELLHDAEEGFLGFDCIAPLKPVLGPEFAAVSSRLSAAVWVRYLLPTWSPESHASHKLVDIASATSEAVHCVGWSELEVRTVLGIQAPVLTVDPLAARHGSEAWRPWDSATAAARFLRELEELQAQV